MLAAGRERIIGRGRLHSWLPPIGLLTLVVLAALLFLYGERILNIATLQTRLAIWRDAWNLWTEFPLLGVGPGGYFWNYPAFMQPSPSADPQPAAPSLRLAGVCHRMGRRWAGMAGRVAWLVDLSPETLMAQALRMGSGRFARGFVRGAGARTG